MLKDSSPLKSDPNRINISAPIRHGSCLVKRFYFRIQYKMHQKIYQHLTYWNFHAEIKIKQVKCQRAQQDQFNREVQEVRKFMNFEDCLSQQIRLINYIVIMSKTTAHLTHKSACLWFFKPWVAITGKFSLLHKLCWLLGCADLWPFCTPKFQNKSKR